MKEQPEKKHILFVSLFGLTELYRAVSRGLEAEGFRVHWITTNEYWTEYLVADGVARDRILQLIYSPSDFPGEAERTAIEEEITHGESRCDLSINQILLMDRFLAERPRSEINLYVCLYYRDIKQFLREKRISRVFAEPTNTNDLITFMLCRELGIEFVSPRDMRYPPGRLVFFDGFRQEKIIPRPGGISEISGKDLIEDFAGHRPTPYYFDRLNHMWVVHPGRIARSALRRLKTSRLVSGRSLTHYSVRGRIRLTAGRAFRSFYMKNICPYTDPDSLEEPLAFYGLHVQPENSIDVLGSYASDQLKLIKDIRRALPFDTTLIVKEHPNFLGMKSLRFFRELKRIPNVRLIRHDVSTFDIYRRARLVLTVSGTTAYEAGLLGIPAVTFSPMYFGGLSSVVYCPEPSQLKSQAAGMLNGFERRFDDDCAFMESLMRNSYDAYWTDPLFDRSVLDEENVEKLTGAFSIIGNHDNR